MQTKEGGDAASAGSGGEAVRRLCRENDALYGSEFWRTMCGTDFCGHDGIFKFYVRGGLLRSEAFQLDPLP